MWTWVGPIGRLRTYYGTLITASGATWPFVGLAAAAPWSKSGPYRGRLFFLPRFFAARSPAKAIFGKLPIFIGRGPYSAPIGTDRAPIVNNKGRYYVARAELEARGARLTDWLHERTIRPFPPARACA